MNYEILKNKFLLLDTNILIDCSKYGPVFKGFLDELINNDVVLSVDQTVRFEFLRYAETPKEKQKLQSFLDLLLPEAIEIPFDKDTVTEAIYIANIYASKNEKRIGLADCFLASAMKKYNEKSTVPRLYLATQNHRDFPEYFFKRVGIETIDRTREDIHNIGFYQFDLDGFKRVEQEYLASKK